MNGHAMLSPERQGCPCHRSLLVILNKYVASAEKFTPMPVEVAPRAQSPGRRGYAPWVSYDG